LALHDLNRLFPVESDQSTLGLAFEPQLLAKFAVAMCELLVERMRDMSRRV
jgi:hypothetical protein